MLIFSLVLWTVLYQGAELVVVRVEQGLLRGVMRERSTGNGQFYSFKGIPYAAPPIGNLRFKAPRPPLIWKGERNATTHGAVCPQLEVYTNKYIPGDEDCLFLNVYTPTMKPEASLTVMFYIHGGGYVSGSGNDDICGPDFLLDQSVVVVTINYRLGALGFLCLDIKEAPGNAGLKDQVAALRWVKKNISKFGGDPNKITIFGQSAGGTSVSLHVLSPMSKGLYKKAITMSGVSFSEFASSFEPKRQGLLLAHKVGLYTEDPQKAFKFLQTASVKSIVTTKPILLAHGILNEYISKFVVFPPVVEKLCGGDHFMLENPERLLLDGKTNLKDIMIGHTSQEGATRAVSQKDYIFETYPYYKEMLVPSQIYSQRDPKTDFEIADRVKKHYFGDMEISETSMKEFIKFYSYLTSVIPVHRYLEMWINGSNKAYLYKFSCFSERNVYGRPALKYGVRGAGHLDDLMYIFDAKKYNLTIIKNSPSYKMVVQTCTLFANFAKYGNPTPDSSLGVKWEYYNKNDSAIFIDLKLTTKSANLTEINFWRRLFQSVGVRFS